MNIFGTDNYDDVQRLWEDMTWKYDWSKCEDVCRDIGYEDLDCEEGFEFRFEDFELEREF